METFDDFRAVEAFRLFAEMANVGQVIYLTHYQHLCDIARRVCPMRAYTSWPCRSCRNAEVREASHPRAVPIKAGRAGDQHPAAGQRAKRTPPVI
ncbi:conserved hypothetical protein [Mesorhizobium delmotii]|uniref:Uncharacterized protein n=1 Tax=Mesorhizobium delmotii TaxID=1631247 RepID=A0A2P9AMU4_9HYPH|nr:conserved hypothetical protein [Mesorhizobium delmotii]